MRKGRDDPNVDRHSLSVDEERQTISRDVQTREGRSSISGDNNEGGVDANVEDHNNNNDDDN